MKQELASAIIELLEKDCAKAYHPCKVVNLCGTIHVQWHGTFLSIAISSLITEKAQIVIQSLHGYGHPDSLRHNSTHNINTPDLIKEIIIQHLPLGKPDFPIAWNTIEQRLCTQNNS